MHNFRSVVGDKNVSNITGDDMIDFRQWWIERMKIEGLTPNSANKDLLHFGDILKTVNKLKRLRLELLLSDLTFKQEEPHQRPAFSKE